MTEQDEAQRGRPLGFDPDSAILQRLKAAGKTIFINSHLLSELEMVCDRVAILVQGRVVRQGRIEDLTADSRRYEIVIVGAAPSWADEHPDLRVEAGNDGQCTLICKCVEAAAIQPFIDRLRAEKRTIHAVRPVRETLEDLFMRAVTDPATCRAFAPGAASDPDGAPPETTP